jgi:2',3'-cyclic-nucleotide 2'-phosphodiesterase (5'-nucleotidase family)
MRGRVSLTAAILALFIGTVRADSDVRLTVAFTANTSGKLAACSCPGDPYGGLVERATLVNRIRKEHGPLLLLDAGNMVSLFGDFEGRAACVMHLMNLMEYSAAGAGRQEMFRGIDRALAMSREAKFPILSAAIADRKTGRPVFTPYIITRIDNVRVGILSVCDSTAYFPDVNRTPDYTVIPLDKALKPVLESMEGATDFIVALSQMERTENEKLLAAYPTIDLVIEGYGNKALDAPLRIAKGYIVCPGSRGQYVGLVALEKTGAAPVKLGSSELFEVLDIPADTKADAIVRAYYRKE